MFGNFLGGPYDGPNWDRDPFDGERVGYCGGCGCLADLNDHACPEIVRIDGDQRLAQIAVETQDEPVGVPVRPVSEPEPTPRQLARAWTDFLAEVGAVEALDLGAWA